MLSTGAFNALLKTLEEPPEHVKFILATTEPQKLPATILSRCQRFDFKKINDEDVVKRLKIICKESNINITEDALKTIAILSEGAMRDAISILERCSQESCEQIDINIVKDLVGLPSLEHINKLSKAIIENDEMIALESIEDVITDGKDLYNFLWEVIKYIKDLLIYKSTNKIDLYSEKEINEIKNLCEKCDKERLLDIIYELSNLENGIKNSSQKTIMLQSGIIKICMNKQCGNVYNLEKRLMNLENSIKNMHTNPQISVRQQQVQRNVQQAPLQNNKKVDANNIAKVDPKSSSVWQEIIDNLKRSGKIRLYTCLVNTNLNQLNDQTWEIIFPNGLTEFNKKILEDPLNKNDLIKTIFLLTGSEINIRLKDTSNNNASPNSSNGLEDLGINVNIID